MPKRKLIHYRVIPSYRWCGNTFKKILYLRSKAAQPKRSSVYSGLMMSTVYSLRWLSGKMNVHSIGCASAHIVICWPKSILVFRSVFIDSSTIDPLSKMGHRLWLLLFSHQLRNVSYTLHIINRLASLHKQLPYLPKPQHSICSHVQHFMWWKKGTRKAQRALVNVEASVG